MVSGRGTRQSSFPKGMRRLSFSVFIRQKKSGGASGSCSGMGVSPGAQGKLKAVSIQDPVEDRPAGHTGPAAADGLCQGLGGLRRGFWRTVPICLNKCGKTPSRSMGRWRSRPLTGAMGKPEQASRIHHWMAWQLSGTMGWALFTISMKSMSPGS